MFKERKYIIRLLGGSLVLILLLLLLSSVEFSIYKMLIFRLNNSLSQENPYISSKCMANLEVFETLEDPQARTMFMWLLNMPDVRKQQTCSTFIKSDGSMLKDIIDGIYQISNKCERHFELIKFIVLKNTKIGGASWGYSYSCEDIDINEKKCSIFNNDDFYEDLYFKKVGYRWLLMKIEQHGV